MITKPRQNDYKLHELREIVIQAIRQNLPDVTQSQLAEILSIHRESIARIEKRCKTKSVADKALHHLAIRAIKDNLKRKESVTKSVKVTKDGRKIEFDMVERPSFTNQLDAAKLVLDRAEPEKLEVEHTGQVEVLHIPIKGQNWIEIDGKVEEGIDKSSINEVNNHDNLPLLP